MNTLKFGNSEWYGTEGNILAYNDENGNFKPLPFDFSRGSSATRVNQQGLIETVGANDARVDYLDNANGALKLEPTRTNLITYSQDFSQWNSYITTPSLNSATSPSGDVNSAKLTSTGVFGNLNLNISKSSSSLEYTQSVFVKAVNYSIVNLISYGSSSANRAQVSFNLSNGSVSSSATVNGNYSNPSESIKDYGNGWYRISLSFTSDTSVEVRPHIQFPIQMTNDNYVLIYGAQLEQGSYPTSIINTQGTVQTRLADSCSQTVSSNIITQAEGTLYWSGHLNNLTNYSNLISLSGGGGSWVYILSYSGGLTFEIKSNYSTSLSFNPSGYAEGSHKIAISYSGSEAVIYINGILAHTDNSVVIPSFSVLNIGEWSGYGQSKETKEVKLYNTRLSNSELAALTQV